MRNAPRAGQKKEPHLTLEQMVEQTRAGESRTFNAGQTEGDERGEFYQIRSTFLHEDDKLVWLNPPPLEALPRKQTFSRPALGVGSCAPYRLEFTGDPSSLADFYQPGSVCFVSDRLLAILAEFDPAGVDAVAAPLRVGDQELAYHAFLPARTLMAADIATNEVTIAKRIVSGVPVPKVVLSQTFRLNPNIDKDVHIFADLAEPRIYWSRSLVEACKAGGITGVSARTGYARSPDTIEM